MKLIYKISLSLSAVLLVFVTLWGIIFFNAMSSEINDETDDMLEEYSKDIIMRWLSGVRLLSTDNGTNNTYYIKRISQEYAESVPGIEYEVADIYIASQSEHEPARIRRQVFMDSDGMYYLLTVAVPTFEWADVRRSVMWSIAALYFVLLVVLIAITIAVLRLNLRPFDALMKWLDSYVPGKKNNPVPVCGDVVEFRKLAKAAQSAADRFERQYQIQNEFIGNASHELQTPLAVCSARIELLLDSPDLTRKQAEELVKMQRSVRNLIRLNRTLLMMSRIENGQFLDAEDIDLSSLLSESAAEFGEIYSYRDVHADIEVRKAFPVKMNSQLASVLVGNLLKNAFLHCPEHSRVSIVAEDGMFRVSNDGDRPLDAGKVFTRFYREDSGKEGSTGLGLALVKTVCDNSNLHISYNYDGRHNFVVTRL